MKEYNPTNVLQINYADDSREYMCKKCKKTYLEPLLAGECCSDKE